MANFGITNGSSIFGNTVAGSTQHAQSASYNALVTTGNSSTSLATGQSTAGTPGFRRGRWFDMLMGTNGTPADNFMEFSVARVTMGASTSLSLGISSLSSNMGLDPADSFGFQALASVNSSVDASYTPLTEVFYVGINQRASYRWVCAPGSELLYPANSSATGNNGLVLRSRSGGYTGTATGTVLFSE